MRSSFGKTSDIKSSICGVFVSLKTNFSAVSAGLSRIIVSVLVIATTFLSPDLLGKETEGEIKIASYRLQNLSFEQIQKVARYFEIKPIKEAGSGQIGFLAFVPEGKTELFFSLAPRAVLMESDVSRISRQAFVESRSRVQPGGGGYHSYDEVQNILSQIAKANPGLAQLVQYGTSQNKKPLWALRVSKHLADGRLVPRVLLTAATHGDEIITTEILLSLIASYVNGSLSDPRFANFIENLEVDFIPVVNPDGFVRQNRYDNGEDPNRSFPFPDQPNQKPTASTQAIINFTQQYPIAGSIDFHAYGRLVMYPWGYTHSPILASDKVAFDSVTAKMAGSNGSVYGPIADVIYVAQGSSADYYYWKQHAFSLGIEVGDSKAPRVSEIPAYIKDQAESTWIFLGSFLPKAKWH